MSPDQQFWWNWAVQFLVALGTFLTVVVALFGDKLKSCLFYPELYLELVSAVGEKTTTDVGGIEQKLPSRWYHLRIGNYKNWPSANGVQVYLTAVEELGPDGGFQLAWSGDLPLHWKHQAVQPLVRTIGPSYPCDLCSITKGQGLSFCPIYVPNNFHWLSIQAPTRLRVHVEARANEGKSDNYKYEISWDGKWEDGDSEMAKHFVIREVHKPHRPQSRFRGLRQALVSVLRQVGIDIN